MQIIESKAEGYKTVHIFESWRIGLIRPAERFSKVEQLERHMLTDEAFILLEGHAKLYDEENVYEMETGKIYNFRKGEYHHVTIEEGGLVMVVENADTSPDNTEKRPYKC